MTRLLILFLLFGVIALIVLIAVYNGLVYRRNRVRQAYDTIDLNLRKRFDLIPALVEMMKGVALHEAETFTQLLEAHERLDRGDLNPAERFRIESQIGAAMARLMALAEDYPEVESSRHFRHLQRNLAGLEAHIVIAREAYNAAVFEINNVVESFPSNVIAGTFGFQRHDFFEADLGIGGAAG